LDHWPQNHLPSMPYVANHVIASSSDVKVLLSHIFFVYARRFSFEVEGEQVTLALDACCSGTPTPPPPTPTKALMPCPILSWCAAMSPRTPSMVRGLTTLHARWCTFVSLSSRCKAIGGGQKRRCARAGLQPHRPRILQSAQRPARRRTQVRAPRSRTRFVATHTRHDTHTTHTH
jgi:hypothetical protein